MKLDWAKDRWPVPAIVQHWRSAGKCLMLGYMNHDALAQTLQSGQVTFFSRSRQRLWTKGETSGHRLQLKSVEADCDRDALLVLANRWDRPVTETRQVVSTVDARRCRFSRNSTSDRVARDRERPPGSYTTTLFDAGVRRIAQKVGEEGVETALAAVAQDSDEHDRRIGGSAVSPARAVACPRCYFERGDR